MAESAFGVEHGESGDIEKFSVGGAFKALGASKPMQQGAASVGNFKAGLTGKVSGARRAAMPGTNTKSFKAGSWMRNNPGKSALGGGVAAGGGYGLMNRRNG